MEVNIPVDLSLLLAFHMSGRSYVFMSRDVSVWGVRERERGRECVRMSGF